MPLTFYYFSLSMVTFFMALPFELYANSCPTFMVLNQDPRHLIQVQGVSLNISSSLQEILRQRGISLEEVAEAYVQGFSEKIPGSENDDGAAWIIGSTKNGKLLSMNFKEDTSTTTLTLYNIREPNDVTLETFDRRLAKFDKKQSYRFYIQTPHRVRKVMEKYGINDVEFKNIADHYLDQSFINTNTSLTTYSIVIYYQGVFYQTTFVKIKEPNLYEIVALFKANQQQVMDFSEVNKKFADDFKVEILDFSHAPQKAPLFYTSVQSQLKELGLTEKNILDFFHTRLEEEDIKSRFRNEFYFIAYNYRGKQYKITFERAHKNARSVIVDVRIASKEVVALWNAKNPRKFESVEIIYDKKKTTLLLDKKMTRRLPVFFGVTREEIIQAFNNKKHPAIKNTNSNYLRRRGDEEKYFEFFAQTDAHRILRVVLKNNESIESITFLHVMPSTEAQLKNYKEALGLPQETDI